MGFEIRLVGIGTGRRGGNCSVNSKDNDEECQNNRGGAAKSVHSLNQNYSIAGVDSGKSLYFLQIIRNQTLYKRSERKKQLKVLGKDGESLLVD